MPWKHQWWRGRESGSQYIIGGHRSIQLHGENKQYNKLLDKKWQKQQILEGC